MQALQSDITITSGTQGIVHVIAFQDDIIRIFHVALHYCLQQLGGEGEVMTILHGLPYEYRVSVQ